MPIEPKPEAVILLAGPCRREAATCIREQIVVTLRGDISYTVLQLPSAQPHMRMRMQEAQTSVLCAAAMLAAAVHGTACALLPKILARAAAASSFAARRMLALLLLTRTKSRCWRSCRIKDRN